MIRLSTALIAATFALIAPAHAAELPKCNSDLAKKLFINVAQSDEVLEIKDRDASADKRWCYAFYIGQFHMSFPYMEAIYTLEWVNEAEGRVWLQVRQSGRSCRGVLGDPWSRERCDGN